MALPTTFASLPAGNAAASLLDKNFNAVGAMAVTACTATGTNTITLTPAANQPTISAYANYLAFGFVAPNTTTSAVQANAGPGLLPVYRPDLAQAGANDIVAGCYYEIVYNSALNGGTGGLQLKAPPIGQLSGFIAKGSITGYLPSSISGNANNNQALTVTSGQAADSTGAAMLSGGSFSWAVANGNNINGYDGGASLPNSSTIHFFVCSGTSGIGSFASTSLTPTFPVGYATYSRRIFSLLTNGSGVLLTGAAVEIEGGALRFIYSTTKLDVNVSNLSTGTLYTISVPQGVKCAPQIRAFTDNSGEYIILTSPDATDQTPVDVFNTAPAWTVNASASGSGVNGMGIPAMPSLITNTSGQIRAHPDGLNRDFALYTDSFTDFRRS